MLPHITLETGKQPQHTIIWLHGLGADGEDFVFVADEMDLPLPVRYIFPHAPKQPVTINGGFVMRAWYDVASADFGTQPDTAGIRASQAEIEKLIAHEIQRGVPAQNIFLAGFSQGGVIALQTGLRQTQKLGGMIALSTYLPLAEKLEDEASASAKESPIFMAHGRSDPVIPYALGKKSAEQLAGLGYALAWHEYPMQHSVCIEEVRDIEAWLRQRLSADTEKGD